MYLRYFIVLVLGASFQLTWAQTNVTDKLMKLMEKAQVPGLQLIYFDKDTTLNFSLGVSSTDNNRSITDKTVFQAASLSKPITAYLTLKMVDLGIFDLDKPLLEYMDYPRLEGVENSELITARHVLSHSSGLPNWGSDPLRLHFIPGKEWRYSGEGYLFLSKALEKVGGIPFQKLVQTHVFTPLKMYSSSFVWLPFYKNRMSNGHNELGDSFVSWKPNQPNAAASLFTTASDYNRFLKAIVESEGLSERSGHLLFTPQNSALNKTKQKYTEDYIKWGIGFGLQISEELALWHWGDNGTFRAFTICYPTSHKGIVYLSNSENGLSIVNDLLKIFLGKGPHWAAQWINYESNDKKRQRRLLFQKAFTRYSTNAAMDIYNSFFNKDTSVYSRKVIHQTLQILLDKKNIDRAELLLNKRLEYDPKNSSLILILGDLKARQKKYQQALSIYNEVLQLDSTKMNLVASRKNWVEKGIQSNNTKFKPLRLSSFTGTYEKYKVMKHKQQLFLINLATNKKRKMFYLNNLLFDIEGYENYRISFKIENRENYLQVSDLNGTLKNFIKSD